MKFLKSISKKNYHKGFTLIETLVSLALFSVVLVIAGGTVVSVIDVNKRNQAISSVVNNLNYSIDSMIRDMKTGYLYKCEYTGGNTVGSLKDDVDIAGTHNNCLDKQSVTLVSTISGQHAVVKYEFVDPADGSNGYIEKTVYDELTGVATGKYGITDKNNVRIEDVSFGVKTPDALECEGPDCVYGQPSISIIIKGMAGSQQIEVSKFYVQTFVSQRLINITDFKD